MNFAIKLKGDFDGYYAGFYRSKGQNYVGCVPSVYDKKAKVYKKKETAEKNIEEIKKSSSFQVRNGCENIVCEVVEVEK